MIREVRCAYNGLEVFRAETSSGLAANPLLTFFLTARESGELVFTWVDDRGSRNQERAALTVSG